MVLFESRMTKEFAMESLQWECDKPYDLYNNELNSEAMNEMLNGDYVAIVDQDNKLIGYYCTGGSAQVPAGNKENAYRQNRTEVGLGMKPSLTGKGLGTAFFSFILEKVMESYGNTPLRLTVATFNERAIRLYERFGFIEQTKFDKSDLEFITMTKD